MKLIKHEPKDCKSIKIEIEDNGKIGGRAFLYIINNDLHDRPYGLLEDLFVEEDFRGKGFGKKLFEAILELAKENNCYKLTAQSRNERCPVHEFYKKNGMIDYGKNFRIDL
ncbi:MAG: hypothetical protein A2725_01665 [Candidatus Magasanikbacteria bacterium RIFCSPHIGHO2_01_FULL_33_34]|uniref:N-acetyltransferase domain-containing protein n=1 Tax=Candidatus Magasanikbacteria bacterium RIFCSPHIGHO2_01_FULL_33_34 TaxID=1798671 RepID=A0A1F6LJK3_9BACT|nr:MAG: hypothetical protein A2725_01665 [Candidatus Magasanikbacteria bacterium RIFCSPHIGHO2_01_FULL_33_34]OGH65518.1 MAG: hypothetical protein A3B83_01420 [Candidatus Magasanikbacteria bacterium RIFCSPHIGHO2_02_FULL_33_17]OGH76228.1 MAG: hypothetical protein A3A89_02240 [Candidatus Magasanikbacteria bacterium RIFCSPLOWO2_01_FULL_33_34]OGH81634.1 MAG: hypothetical protein A3F93_03635 [Candidatus Magasanikbacteria bacterium RIFCSPLOWO2_12_FULL_34_7]